MIIFPQHYEQKKSNFNFIFKLSDGHSIGIKMTHILSYFFSGMCLTHRQSHNLSDIGNDSLFFNLGSCDSKQLFSHMKCSFIYYLFDIIVI